MFFIKQFKLSFWNHWHGHYGLGYLEQKKLVETQSQYLKSKRLVTRCFGVFSNIRWSWWNVWHPTNGALNCVIKPTIRNAINLEEKYDYFYKNYYGKTKAHLGLLGKELEI